MGKFTKALTKMGLVEEEVKVTPKAPPVAPKVTQPTVNTIPVFTPSTDPAITEKLQQSLQDNKLSGFDYLKFISAVEKMKSTGVSEDTRYKMAFSAASEFGVKKTDLLTSGKHYLDVLEEDEQEFNSNCAQFEKKEISAKEAKVNEITKNIASLTQQLADLQQEEEKLKQELQEGKDQLDSKKSAFQTTLQEFKATIESNIDKINQYL